MKGQGIYSSGWTNSDTEDYGSLASAKLVEYSEYCVSKKCREYVKNQGYVYNSKKQCTELIKKYGYKDRVLKSVSNVRLRLCPDCKEVLFHDKKTFVK
jgi:hypothetical protein